MRRRVIELEPERDVQFRYRGDFEYWLRVGLHGPCAYLPQTLVTWRSHDGGATTAALGPEMGKEHIEVIEKLYSRSDLPAVLHKVKREAFSNAYYVAGWVSRNDRKVARRYFIRSILAHPFCFRAYPQGNRRPWRRILSLILLPKKADRVLDRAILRLKQPASDSPDRTSGY